jgi:hypothetical protein
MTIVNFSSERKIYIRNEFEIIFLFQITIQNYLWGMKITIFPLKNQLVKEYVSCFWWSKRYKTDLGYKQR